MMNPNLVKLLKSVSRAQAGEKGAGPPALDYLSSASGAAGAKGANIKEERVYLASLDGLRFIAFVAVLSNHIAPPSDSWAYGFHTRGWIGVDLFFAISSFLFFTLFQVEYRRTGRIGVKDFFIRRLLRLYPLMVLAPLLLMVFYGRLDDAAAWKQLASIALFIDNLPWFDQVIPNADHLWSLSFEFQVYLVMPAAFCLCLRSGKVGFAALLVSAWLACVSMRWYYAMLPAPHPIIYFSPLLRPDSIIAGVVVALLIGQSGKWTLPAAGLLTVSTLIFATMPSVKEIGLSTVFLYPVVALICGSLLWMTLKTPWLTKILSNKALVYLGKRTFGIYVFHLAARSISNTWLMPTFKELMYSPIAAYYASFLSTGLIAVAMAAVSYHFLERPFLVLKDRRAVVLTRPV